MALGKKQRSYRKKVHDSDDDTTTETTSIQGKVATEDVSHTIEELQELRRLRRKQGGVDAEKLLKGDIKKKKKPKKPVDDDAWSLQKGGLVDKDAFQSGKAASAEEEDGKGKKVRLDAFTSQTNKLDVDKHMMKYIETELKKKRSGTNGDEQDDDDDDESAKQPQVMTDIYEELYHLPDRLKFASEAIKEGNVQHSTQMLTAIPEVDLGISAQLNNIEDTERAKRKLMEEKQPNDVDDSTNHRFEKQRDTRRPDRRQWATDEAVAERFKKRMRK